MKKSTTKSISSYFKGPPPQRTCPDRFFVNEDGVECVESHWNDGVVQVLKIYNPDDPKLVASRKSLADIPCFDLEKTISDLRD